MTVEGPITGLSKFSVGNLHCNVRYSILLHSSRETDDGEEESVGIKVLKHALHRLPVDPEGHAGSAQIQAATDHIVRVQQVLVNGGHGSGDPTWETRADLGYSSKVTANAGQND